MVVWRHCLGDVLLRRLALDEQGARFLVLLDDELGCAVLDAQLLGSLIDVLVVLDNHLNQLFPPVDVNACVAALLLALAS